MENNFVPYQPRAADTRKTRMAVSMGDGEEPAVLCRGAYFTFHRSAGGWEYVDNERSRHVVAVAAVTPEGMLVLVEQHRPPVATTVLELPAGLAEANNLAAEAAREFHEETGLCLLDPKELFTAPVLPGLTTSILHVFTGVAVAAMAPLSKDIEREVTDVILVSLEPLLDGDTSALRRASVVDRTVYSALFHLQQAHR